MRRSFGLLVAPVATVLALLALVGIPLLSGGSSASVASAATTSQQIGLKVLLITDSTANSQIAYADWENTLKREGVPFDSMVTNDASPGSVPLPALSSTLPNGTQVANYEGVVVATSGTLGLSTAQYTTLQTFEHQFSVREVAAYVVPSSDYGLTAPNPAGGGAMYASNTPLTLTAAGASVFPYLNKVSLDPCTTCTFGYDGTPLTGSALPKGASVQTLISGPNSSSLLGIYTSADGRETMYQTFNQNPYLLQSELLRHGELAWLARSTYFGDQRNYLETDIDDNFLSDDSWDTTTHSTDYTPADALRETGTDVINAAKWSDSNTFRIDDLFNGGGSVAWAGDNGSDPLLAQFQTTCSSNCGPGNAGAGKSYANSFGWINHTWDHPNLDQGCATQAYIEAEIQNNTNWAASAPGGTLGDPTATTGGLGLTADATGATALGAENPGVVVTGEHAGLANLIPGNPGIVDPPEWDATTVNTTGGTLAAGTYEYAITDDFTIGGPQSSASETQDVLTVPGSVTLTWGAVCHAAEYKIYRENLATPGTWVLLSTIEAPTTAPPNSSFGDPTSTSLVGNGGALEQTLTDTGTAGTAATAPSTTTNLAVESAYEQNTLLPAAFTAIGLTAFGADASKPYPNPATATFATGSPPASQFAAGQTFIDGGAQAVPRYPTNIYYNVSTEAQEVDEYNYLYLPPPAGDCVNSATTTCLTAAATFADIIGSVDTGMFGHMMGNDPRPDYFHQTNMMGMPPAGSEAGTGDLPPSAWTPPATAPATGDGLYYSTMDPLLYQYDEFFSVPLIQPTMLQIASLLAEQSAWAGTTAVTANIEGNVVTVTNSSGGAIETPLTGISGVGSPYGGTQSGWISVPAGTSTYTALAAWPAQPSGPVIVTPPMGPAPGSIAKVEPKLTTIQVGPKTVHIKHGRDVTVSLKCEAPKGDVCKGTFTLKVSKRSVKHSFKIKASKISRIAVRLPKKVKLPQKARKATPGHRGKRATALHATLAISTNQLTLGSVITTHGKLTIKR